MSTWQHDRVLYVCEADHTLGLGVSGCSVSINTKDIVQLEDRLVVKQLLLEELELVNGLLVVRHFEGAVSELDLLPDPAFVALGEVGLDRDDDWIVVFTRLRELLLLEQTEI
jgi:hypothetical protein